VLTKNENLLEIDKLLYPSINTLKQKQKTKEPRREQGENNRFNGDIVAK
jgi:hypothetical protein